MNRNDVWLLFAGFIASSVNAAAGGGTLLSFPALLAAGLSPLAANATSTVGLLPGSFASIAAYRRELGGVRAEAVRLLWPSIIGGAFGAFLLVFLGDSVFAAVVPALLLGSSVLLVAQPLALRFLQRGQASVDRSGARFGLTAVLAATLVIAIYAGYFGAGAGILFLGAMGLLLDRSLASVNALKVVMAFIANAVAAIAFAVMQYLHPANAALHFREALPLGLGALLGGYLGVGLVRKLPPSVLRAFAALIGVGIALYLALRR